MKIKKKYLIILLLPPFLFLSCISFVRFFIYDKNPNNYLNYLYEEFFHRVIINPWHLNLSKNIGFIDYDHNHYQNHSFLKTKKPYIGYMEFIKKSDYKINSPFCKLADIKNMKNLSDYPYCFAFRKGLNNFSCGLWHDLRYGVLNCDILDTTEEIINDPEIKARLEDALKNPCKYIPPKIKEGFSLHNWGNIISVREMYYRFGCNKPKTARETTSKRQIYIRVFSTQGKFLYQKHLKEILNY